jgi:hypothetical protein
MKFLQNIIACNLSYRVLDFFGLTDVVSSSIASIYQAGWIDAQSRRKNWSDFIQVFNEEFSKLEKKYTNIKFDIPSHYDTFSEEHPPRNGRVYSNRNVAQFEMVNRPSGVGYKDYKEGKENRLRLIVERGGAVVFSQFHTGEVGIILYPSSLELDQENREYLLLKVYKSPGDIDPVDVRYYFHLCILYSFETSFFGHMSLFTRAHHFYLRNKANVWYVLLGGVIGFVASILASKVMG